MKPRLPIAATIAATVCITVILYDPVAFIAYKIKEPYFRYPLKTESRILSIRNDAMGEGDFGAKRRNGRAHSGIDIQAQSGSPVYASKSGIAFCGNVPTGYGKYIMIYHPDGFQTIYGHLSNWAIDPVKKVNRGDLIGFVGKTGNAAGRYIQPHLHFEIKKDGKPRDPQPLMR